jgi:mannose/cellobiose epimerase-like protein (N-acyl-D-glucosamine 2-epimerase family)
MRPPATNNLPLDDRLRRATFRFESWIRNQALPLWAHAGFDPSSHASYERLLADGAPDLKADMRVRVQARQVFVFALAHHLDWYDNGQALAEKALAFVEHSGAHPVAGYVHMLDHRYRVIDGRQDLYDHAFFLLAHAWCYRAFGKRSALEKASKLLNYLDRAFASDKGGWNEGNYRTAYRRQNPHMHMLEAFLSLYDASHDDRWLIRAGEVVQLFETRFYDPARKVLLEYFTPDWAVIEGEKGERVEPGHMMEWVWLLRWYESRAGRPVAHFADALYSKVLSSGIHSGSGLLLDEIAPDGRVLAGTKRCWPQTEYIKACIAQARAGRPGCEAHAADAIDRLFRYYLDDVRIPGLYLDRRGVDDEILDTPVPASTLYHLVVAAAEASAYCRERGQ